MLLLKSGVPYTLASAWRLPPVWQEGDKEGVGGGGERNGGPTIINLLEQDRTSYHLPGGCYRCRWLSTLHSYRLGRSGRVGNHGEDPTPCRGWTHRMDASLDEREESRKERRKRKRRKRRRSRVRAR